MFQKILKTTKDIDSRIIDILRENLKSMEDWVEKEISKAWYIMWLQWTILFIAAMKLWTVENIYIKIIILWLFIISWAISYFTISWEWKIKHVKFWDKLEFSREKILKDLEKFYLIAEKMFFKKIRLNKINMILQVFTLFIILLALLFPRYL